jgi:hypothetical protein
MKKAKDGTDKVVTSSDAMHKGLIPSRLEDGVKIACYIPGHKQAIAFGRAIQARCPDLKVKVMVGNKSNDNQHDFSEDALTADLLIFNNAMNTGVSYDRLNHYDEVHIMLGQGSITDGIHVEQAVHRIRHPKSKTFVISGGIGTPINDGRITPEHHLKAAEKRVAAATLAFKKLGNFELEKINLPLDYLASQEAQRLAKFQATILANRFACGLRWVLPWLAVRHEFVGVEGVKDKEFVEDVRDNRQEVAAEEAEAVAQAEPLDERGVARVEAQGADTEAEHDRYRNAKMAGMFGEAFVQATPGEKAKIVLEVAEKQLVKKTRVMAASRLIHLSDEARIKLLRMDAKRAETATTVTLDSVVPAGLVVREVLMRLAAIPTVEGKLVITKEDALAVCQATRHHYAEAGFKIRDDLATAPHRQLAHVLSLAGLKMAVRRVGVKGERRREYTLDENSAERMGKLSVAFMARWTADEDVVEIGAV